MSDRSKDYPNNVHMERQVRRKLDVRLLLPLCWLSVVTALDTMGVGNARIMGLPADLKMGKHDFNIAVMVFYIPCILFAVPANIAIQAVNPAWFIGGLAMACGLVTVCAGVTQVFGGLVACRFFMGLFQTCVQAGSIFTLAVYYPRRTLHKRISALLASRLLANACGGLLAYGVVHLDGDRGLSAWRWLFIIEGVLTCVSGLVSILVLPGWPNAATFLDPDKKATLHESPRADFGDDAWRWWPVFEKVIREPKLYFGIILQFCLTGMSSSSVVFLPTIIREFDWSRLRSLSMTAPIFFAALVVMVICGALSDYKKLRYPFCAGPLLWSIAAYSILLAANHVNVGVRYMACFFLISGNFTSHAAALVWLSNNFVGKKPRGLALGIVASLGNCGHLLGSNIFLEQEMPRYRTGFSVCLVLAIVAVATATVQLCYFVWGNGRKALKERDVYESDASSQEHPMLFRNMY